MSWLGIDAATRPGSVGLLVETNAFEQALAAEGWHARDLLAAIAALLERASSIREDLRGVGVAVGPGSFTGVRVGMATAKGLGLALDIPVAGLSTLEAMARAVAATASHVGSITPVLDAGRGEVYAALFEARAGTVERREQDRAWKPADLAAALPAEAVLVGDGSAAVLAAAGRAHRLLETPLLGATVARWAATVPATDGRYHAGGLGPNYVRPSDVEAARRRT